MSRDTTPFSIKKSPKGYIKTELNARQNPVVASSMKPWIRATSNLGGGKTLITAGYSNLFGSDGMYNPADQNRPNPIITGWSIDFSARGTLRKGTLKIQCFTARQLSEIQKYFMEPAVSIFVEWGWNKSAALGKTTSPSQKPRSTKTQELFYRDDVALNAKRDAENGCYDNMMGVITKATSEASGGEFVVSCTITSLGELLMGASRRGQEVPKTDSVEDTDKYSDVSFGLGLGANMKRNWMFFFNSLPNQFQTSQLKKWGERGGGGQIDVLNDFINYDETWAEDIKSETSRGQFENLLGIKDKFTFLGKNFTAFDNNNPIIDKKYVKFSAFVAIFNFVSKIKGSQASNILTPFLNIGTRAQGTYISSFPNIFSPDPRIFIPNKKSYNWYLLNPYYTSANGSGEGEEIKNLSDGMASFPSESTTVTLLNGAQITVPQGGVGWIGDIYISSELMDSVFNDSDGEIKDLFDGLLSGISDASQGMWNFQIISSTINGKLQLEIVDAKMSDGDGVSALELHFIGPNSVFLDANYNLDLPKAMANKIALARSNPSVNDVDGISRIFSDGDKDVVMETILLKSKIESVRNQPPPEPSSSEEEQARQWEGFCKYAGICIDPKTAESGGFIKSFFTFNVDKYLLPGISTNVEKFNELRITAKQKKKTSSVQPLPVKIGFTVLGISGFRFGDALKIIGLPKPFDDTAKGYFLVTEVTHKVDDKAWTTEVEAQYRPTY